MVYVIHITIYANLGLFRLDGAAFCRDWTIVNKKAIRLGTSTKLDFLFVNGSC